MSTFHLPTVSQAAWCHAVADRLTDGSIMADMADSFIACPAADHARIAEAAPLLAQWIRDGMSAAAKTRTLPMFVDREVSLEEAMEAFSRPVLPGEWRMVPVSTIGNDPVSGLMNRHQNLEFRFLHDWLHARLKADATFRGELCLTLAHMCSAPQALWWVFASEVAGQAAVAITAGEFPEQKLAGSCWNVLWLAMADKLVTKDH